jgi:hypothetical protein
MGDAFFLPSCGGGSDEALQGVHDGSHGTGCTPHRPLPAQSAEKLAEGFSAHPSCAAAPKQCGHDSADQPGTAGLRFPQRRLRVSVSTVDGLEMTRHTAFGQASAIGQTPDVRLAIRTNRGANANALGPQSHGVGPYSEGWLTSRKSALQSTRSTATCPALRGCPTSADVAHLLVGRGPRNGSSLGS